LNEINNFDSKLALNEIDKENIGAVTDKNLKAFLDANNQNILDEEAQAIIKLYDLSNKGAITAADLEQALIPKSNPFIK
jgi:Ca2+-binding EF-hand superfamily protein